MRVRFLKIIRLLILLLIFAQCKKEGKDEMPPEIRVFSPSANQVYSMGDSIPVSFTVSDNLNIEFVSIHLTDQNGIIVQGQYSLTEYNIGKNFSLNFLYPLVDETLESGSYFIKISAGDGTVVSTKNISLLIDSPLKKLGYCIGFKKNNFQFESVYSDTNFILNPFQNCTYATLPVAFLLSGKQKLYSVIGKNAEPMKIFSLYNFQLVNTEYSNGNSQPYFTCAKEDRDYFYIGYYNDSVCMRYPNGNAVVSFSSGDPNKFPVTISTMESNVGIQFLSKNAAMNRFIVFDKLSAQIVCSYYNFDSKILSFNAGNNKSYLVEESAAGNNSISLLNHTTGTVFNLVILPAGQIKDAVQIDNNTLLISFNNGNLYQYQYSTNSLNVVWSNSILSKLVFSPSENLLYALNANKIEIFSISSSGVSLVQNFIFTDTLTDLKIQFNR